MIGHPADDPPLGLEWIDRLRAIIGPPRLDWRYRVVDLDRVQQWMAGAFVETRRIRAGGVVRRGKEGR